MERLQWILYAGLVFVALFVLISAANRKIYITSDPNSCSHNLNHNLTMCITFQEVLSSKYYNMFPEGTYITLVFMKGTHSLSKPSVKSNDFQFLDRNVPHSITARHLIMEGTSSDVIIQDANISFKDIYKLHIKNLTLINGYFHILMAKETTQLSLLSITTTDFVLAIEYATLAQLKDCTFLNGASPLTIRKSNVTFSGNSKFFNNHNSALVSYSSTVTLSETAFFVNNSGIRGGAMALYSSTIHLIDGLNISFINNSAQETGGAIHIEPDMTRSSCPDCFYEVLNHDMNITVYYSENLAQFGGDNIYGTSLALCDYQIDHRFLSNVSMSAVSSNPTQVCLCDSNGQIQCETVAEILTSKSVHPGEKFTIPAVIVGGDYGTTIGIVHASFMPTEFASVPGFKSSHQYSQWIGNNSMCTDLEYSVYTKEFGQIFTMYLVVHYSKHPEDISKNSELCNVMKHGYISNSPTYINLTILQCPMGFSLLENPFTCDCNPTLTHNGFKCSIVNGTSHFSWNSTLWINITDTGFIYTKYCPLHYCDPAGKQIKLVNEPFAQCTFNRAGRLCGGCKENYSLAIGSSHCIHCPNNNGLALLIFFAAAGFLLVFFISTLNITLTQGLLGGLIFYANIVWTYQSILFPKEHSTNPAIIFLKTFIAWLNLDFGIETCFVQGLTAYWKTWLQFIFPFYIWAIVGLMVFTARYSRTLTRIYGNRAVPVLTTLFLLSYMKLLRTVTSIYMFSDLVQYPEKSKAIVWSVDGTVDYFGLPHALLLVTALIVQIFLWLPYTLTLLLHQKLQKVSHIRLFKWVANLKPFFDVHFAPFKPAHRYWFGVLLLARGSLLIIFSTSFATPKNTNLLLLLITVIILLLYMAIVQPYRNKIILIFQSSFLANILLISIFVLYAESHANKYVLQTTAVGISIGQAFLQFCGIIICSVIKRFCRARCSSYRNRANLEDELELEENFSTTYRAYIMKALF